MKTTIEVPDELYRRAKAEAALRGRRMRDLVEEGLRMVLDKARISGTRPTLAELVSDAAGSIDSGVSDLATNPKYMKGFGEDDCGNR